MISEQIAQHIGLKTPRRESLATPFIFRGQLTSVGGTARKVMCAVITWIKLPLLPYAALWEASAIVTLIDIGQGR